MPGRLNFCPFFFFEGINQQAGSNKNAGKGEQRSPVSRDTPIERTGSWNELIVNEGVRVEMLRDFREAADALILRLLLGPVGLKTATVPWAPKREEEIPKSKSS